MAETTLAKKIINKDDPRNRIYRLDFDTAGQIVRVYLSDTFMNARPNGYDFVGGVLEFLVLNYGCTFSDIGAMKTLLKMGAASSEDIGKVNVHMIDAKFTTSRFTDPALYLHTLDEYIQVDASHPAYRANKFIDISHSHVKIWDKVVDEAKAKKPTRSFPESDIQNLASLLYDLAHGKPITSDEMASRIRKEFGVGTEKHEPTKELVARYSRTRTNLEDTTKEILEVFS